MKKKNELNSIKTVPVMIDRRVLDYSRIAIIVQKQWSCCWMFVVISLIQNRIVGAG